METVRVDICYRPLRIAWAIKAGDMDALRAAARTSFALWGGRFNPIVIVDQEKLAQQVIDAFRVDVVVPVGESEEVKQFPKKFPHLITPFFRGDVFVGDGEGGARSHVLDVNNALVHAEDMPGWKAIKERGFRIYTWAKDDPLSDVLLMHLGEYLSKEEIKIDYRGYLTHVSGAKEVPIDPAAKLPADLFDHPSIAFISRIDVERRYRIHRGWDTPGFFHGDASNFDDLVCYWNLRAGDIQLMFVDVKHLERHGEAVAAWGKAMSAMVSHRRDELRRRLAVWVREEHLDLRDQKAINEITKPFEGKVTEICRIPTGELNIHPPMMYFGEEISTLGVIGMESGKPRISFSLDHKPFSDDGWFHTQMLVASLSFIGGLYGDEEHILIPPYIPELNQFYAREMHFHYDRLRSESERIGLVIDATDKTTFIYALPVSALVGRIFDLAGFSASLSSGGLIARQLITQLGGVDGARAFKIPGVRRLLKTHGPTAAFTKKSAVHLIGSRDPQNPKASFQDYEELYIEPRPPNTKLEPAAVFAYLVQKGLFRMGAELKCPHCGMNSWTALDALKQRVVCEMCGREFDATRQLVEGAWHYRRSGVLGAERNAQGAIPVVLTLQQFTVNLGGFQRGMYSPSLDLVPKLGKDLPKCEMDFVWVIPEPYPDKTVVMIGECKDQGGQNEAGEWTSTIDAADIDHLRRVADALPQKRFSAYIVLAKLSPFTAEEIALAKTLNDQYLSRTILLTARELEPYHLYERTQLEFNQIEPYGSTPERMANNTAMMYFRE